MITPKALPTNMASLEAVAIRITPDGQEPNCGYRLELLRDPFGTRNSVVGSATLPVGVVDAAPWTPDGMRARVLQGTGASPDFHAIGQRLWEWLDRDSFMDGWRRTVQGLASRKALTLLDIRSRRLSHCPWELVRTQSQLLFADPQYPWARLHAQQQIRPPEISQWPVRVLVALGTEPPAPGQPDAIQLGAELEALERELLPVSRSVDLDIFAPSSQDELRTRIGEFQPHILHFIGHGDEDAVNGEAMLVFEPTAGSRWNWLAHAISLDMGLTRWRPRVVVLNACRSAQGAQASFSVADAFVSAGATAVISMQADIRGDVAGTFAGRLYKTFPKERDVDEAVAAARAFSGNLLHACDWALPVLSLSISPEDVLPGSRGAATNLPLIKACPAFLNCRQFADRRAERRKVIQTLLPVRLEQEMPRVLVVTGDPKVGKSTVVHWCLANCLLSAKQARYVEISNGRPKNFLDVLRDIVHGDPNVVGSVIHDALPKEAFYQFFWELPQMLAGTPRDRVKPWDRTPALDRPEEYKYTGKGSPSDIIKSFYEGLEKAASGNELVIALDRFTGDTGYRSYDAQLFAKELLPHLVFQVAQNVQARVRLIMVVDHTEYEKFALQQVEALATVVRLEKLPGPLFRKLAREFFWYSDDQQLNDVIELRARYIEPRWLPEELASLRSIVKMWNRPVNVEFPL